nr:helix-turn-helix transcriptional regulator [uncultured Allomuricauda sp.]
MDYRTYEPDSDLKAIIKCYWTLEGDESDIQKQVIVPDGCMEMIFHFADLYKQFLVEDTFVIQPRCFLMGQLSKPLEIEPTGKTGIFSVRFHPDGFLPFVSFRMTQIQDTAVPLTTLFGDEGQMLEKEILTAKTTKERIESMERFIDRQLQNKEVGDKIIQMTLQTILAENGQLSIDGLSKNLNVHRRKLERRFDTAIGMSPKRLSKIMRLQAALKKLLNAEFDSLTGLAYDIGYYDQAHFIKEFKEFTGFTPGEFYGDHIQLSTLFYRT